MVPNFESVVIVVFRRVTAEIEGADEGELGFVSAFAFAGVGLSGPVMQD